MLILLGFLSDTFTFIDPWAHMTFSCLKFEKKIKCIKHRLSLPKSLLDLGTNFHVTTNPTSRNYLKFTVLTCKMIFLTSLFFLLK